MATITVEPTESGILVSEAGNNDEAVRLDPLPPLKAARYLVVASDSVESLRHAETPLVESIRPYAHSTLVALEAGFGTAVESEDEPPAKRLAAALGVTVVAPEGRFLSCDGALFAVGADNGWVAYGPLGAKIVHGRRYPGPSWQAQLPGKVDGTVQIPAGLWITDGAAASHAVHLADIAVHPQQLLIVVGSPGEPAPEYTRIRDVLRSLPDATRASAVLIGYDEASLAQETIRLLAAELQEPLRIAHGVTMAGEFVRLDRARESLTATFAKESVCTPEGTFELDRWSAPLGLTTVSRNTYRLKDDWVVDVVPAGLVVRPAVVPPGPSAGSHPVVAQTLTVLIRAEGADDPRRVIAPLRMLLERLRDYATTQLTPGDRVASRLIRNAFPGVWAPTARLAVTEDGRIIAATVDEYDVPIVEEQHVEPPEKSELTDEKKAIAEAVGIRMISESAHVSSPDGMGFTGTSQNPVVETGTAITGEAAPVVTQSKAKPEAVTSATSHYSIAGVSPISVGSSNADAEVNRKNDVSPSHVEVVASRQPTSPQTKKSGTPVGGTDASYAANAVTAPSRPVALPTVASSDPTDALARALRGSAATAELLEGAASRNAAFDATDAITGVGGTGSAELTLGEETPEPDSGGFASAHRPAEALAEEPAESIGDETAADERGIDDAPSRVAALEKAEAGTSAPAVEKMASIAIDVPRAARSTAEQRHRVRSALGARYDVASRSVSQLLAQQPGMRVSSGDRSTLLTTLSVVSVFADDPTARYDLDFHTCLAEGLAALPTTRTIVVHGLPETSTASMNTMLYSRTPFISAPADGPLTGPMEALIWTTSGRRLDRLMAGTDAARDVIMPAHTQLRVLGTSEGPVRRLLLAEEGVNGDNVLTRLHDAAANRDNESMQVRESRWLGELLAVD